MFELALGLPMLAASVLGFSGATYLQSQWHLRKRGPRVGVPPVPGSVVVTSQFPMELLANFDAFTHLPQALLHERVLQWSRDSRYAMIEHSDTHLRFSRGSHWLASCSFDVRHVPTETVFLFLPTADGVTTMVQCRMRVASPWQYATESDCVQLGLELEAAFDAIRDQ